MVPGREQRDMTAHNRPQPNKPQPSRFWTILFFTKKGKGIKVANWLMAHEVDILITSNEKTGKGPNLVLSNAGAEIFLTEKKKSSTVDGYGTK